MAAQFVGKWNLESSENFDEYMKAVGVGAIMAKLGSTAKPTLIIEHDGDTWTIKSETTFKSTKIVCKLGVEFDETTADDRKMKTTLTLEGNKLIQDQKGEIPSVITRTVDGNKMIVECSTPGKTGTPVVATRHYVKAS
jgi:hypothetical protein